MRKYYLLFIISLISCEQRREMQQKSLHVDDKPTQVQHIDGIYEYVYPHNTADLIENHYIVLKSGAGLYYGTSDEFDEARTEYLPAFFVARMQDLNVSNASIKFNLKITSADLFTRAVSLKLKSSLDAKNAGYKQWGVMSPLHAKMYKGTVKGDTLYFKAETPDLDKRFVKRR
jgi:hypothetical protein